MLILNPERLQATTQPLLSKDRTTPAYAGIVRLTLAALPAVAALLVGHAVTQYLAGLWPAWSAFAAVGVFVYLASLAIIVVRGLSWQVPIAVIWGASFALGLPWRTGAEAFALAGIVAVSGVLAAVAYDAAVRSYAALHTFTVLRQYASILATGVVIAFIVLYGSAVSRGSALLPQGILASATDRAAQFVPTLLPGVGQTSSTVSIQDLATASAKAQLESDPRYKALGPEEQARVLAEAARQAAASFTKQLGVNAAPSASIGTAAQGAISTMLERFQDRYGIYFTIAWLLGAFFIARSAAVLLTLVIAALAWATIAAALALGLLTVQTIPSIHEEISL